MSIKNNENQKYEAFKRIDDCLNRNCCKGSVCKSAESFKIKDVIFNDPATIVFWEDGTKTVVKCSSQEEFDYEKGLAMAIAKKVLDKDDGNTYYDEMKKWIQKHQSQVEPFIDLKMLQSWMDILRSSVNYAFKCLGENR